MSPTVGVVLALLVLATAFYVAAEFAAVGVRRSRIRRMSDDGSVLASRLLPFVQQPAELDRYVAVSQVGITLASLILGAVAQGTIAVALTPNIATLFDLDPRTAASASAVIVLVFFTALLVLFGELIPKSLALQYPTEVALATVLPMRWSLAAFRPLIWLLNGSATALLRLFGMQPGRHRHLHSPEEIALLFVESRDGGLLEADEQRRLHKALRLSRRTAKDLMVAKDELTMIDVGAPWQTALDTVAAAPFSRLPAYRGTRDNIVGVLRVKDLVHRYIEQKADGPQFSIASLIRPYARVPADLPGDQVVALLREKRTHLGAVVDVRGTVLGFLTIHDVLGEFLESTGAQP